MTEHDSESDDSAYTSGYRKAQSDDRGNLAAVLHGLIQTGEPPLETSVALEIFAAVHGVAEAEREFGADPRIENIIDGLFE